MVLAGQVEGMECHDEDVLNFTFEREKKMDFYPYETMFKEKFL